MYGNIPSVKMNDGGYVTSLPAGIRCLRLRSDVGPVVQEGDYRAQEASPSGVTRIDSSRRQLQNAWGYCHNDCV